MDAHHPCCIAKAKGRGDSISRSVKSLLGRSVKASTGQTVGVVSDVCIDPVGVRLAALVLTRSGLFRTPQMVYWQDISVSADGLRVESTAALRPLTEVPPSWWSTHKAPGVWGRALYDATGRLMGLVSDLLIDRRGRIIGCRVSDGVLKDLVVGQPELIAQMGLSSDGEGLEVTLDVQPEA